MSKVSESRVVLLTGHGHMHRLIAKTALSIDSQMRWQCFSATLAKSQAGQGVAQPSSVKEQAVFGNVYLVLILLLHRIQWTEAQSAPSRFQSIFQTTWKSSLRTVAHSEPLQTSLIR